MKENELKKISGIVLPLEKPENKDIQTECPACGLPWEAFVKDQFNKKLLLTATYCCNGDFVSKYDLINGEIVNFVLSGNNGIIRCRGIERLKNDQTKAEYRQAVGFSDKFKNCRFENFKPSPPNFPGNLEKLKQALENEKNRIIFLFGNNQTGKSSLACAAGNWYIDQLKSVRYLHAEKIQNVWRKGSFETWDQGFEDLKETIYRQKLLIIDDLGFAVDANLLHYQALAIYDIMEHSEGKIIITSNWKMQEISQKFGDDWGNKIISRLMNAEKIGFVGSPYKEG